jgi:hypothetical protein
MIFGIGAAAAANAAAANAAAASASAARDLMKSIREQSARTFYITGGPPPLPPVQPSSRLSSGSTYRPASYSDSSTGLLGVMLWGGLLFGD